ncbi:MAG: glycosyltransferase family 4 protein [Candidatus Omnitrophota bacterium]
MAQFFFCGDLRAKNGLTRLLLYQAREIDKTATLEFICKGVNLGDFGSLHRRFIGIDVFKIKKLLSLTPLRWKHRALLFVIWDMYDRWAAKYVKPKTDVFAVQGQALYIFKKAEKVKSKKILITHTPHIDFVWQMHREEEKKLGHNYEWLSLRLKEKMLREYNMADEIIVPSVFSQKTHMERGIAKDKIKVVLLDIDREYFKRRHEKKDGVFRVLYVGRLTPEKGIHYLIDAFCELSLPNSELLLFGGTETKQVQKWLDKQIKRADNIITDRGDPRPAYEQASVLVHPSLQDSFGFTIPEALAYSLPVIVSENTGAKYLVREGDNGFVVPARNAQKLKEKIGLLC